LPAIDFPPRSAGGAILFPALAFVLMSGPPAGPADAETFFETRIRPVLAGTCFKCHGGEKVSGSLRLDSRPALLKGGERGPAVVPGAAEKSRLIRAMRHVAGDELRMPPGKKLPDATIADFVIWIDHGAVWPRKQWSSAKPLRSKHWAFQPPRTGEPPPDRSGWSENPIDRFITAGWREQGLGPVEPCDRRTLLRRVTFDLIGLPPTVAEMDAFLADPHADAFARVVDRLLAAPSYGERWGRHWLDLVRYADTAGDNADYPVPEARLYRDYVIDSFNADKPYDLFLREQLAGDILALRGPREHYAAQVIATTYLALSRRYLTAPYEHWHLTLEDTIDTTGRAFLGLTLRCARCHDHKYDPITQQDYYALYGIFASTQFPYAGSEEFASMSRPREHFVPLVPPAEAAPRLAARRQAIQKLQAAVKKHPRGDPLHLQLQKELTALEKTNLPADLPGAYAVSEGKAVDVPLQRAGDPDRPGPVVPRGVPAFLNGGRPVAMPQGSSGRLELADWLVAPSNPLTARVLVNRIWQYHFGRGLVATPSNFGVRGEPPSHPELLDWLAERFIKNGWSIKSMHRLIVMSRTYQLASTHDPKNAALDPANRWYWRFDRRRLDAEAIRDAMLTAGGHLDRRRPGRQPFPAINDWKWTQHAPFKEVYATDQRSVYLMTQRLQRHPFLALFDGPDTNVTTDVRGSSTVPLQALFLMNNPFLLEQARGLAQCSLRAGKDPRCRLECAYQLAWSRPPDAAEIERAQSYVEQCCRELARAGVPAEARELEAWTSLARVLLASNEFVYVD
jgi:hypothetical protein